MSSKKKSTRSEWIACQICDILVGSRDWTNHKTQCAKIHRTCRTPGQSPMPSSSADSPGGNCNETGAGFGSAGDVPDELPTHGFIRNGVLFGEVCSQVEKGNEKLLSSCHSLMIHLNPDTMRLCNLCIGRPVLLTTCRSKVRLIGTAWPVANFPSSSVGISNHLQEVHGIVGNELVGVEAVCGRMLSAAEVKLYSTNDGKFLQSAEFKQYFLRAVEGRCVLAGSVLSVNFYGKPVVTQILQITLIDGTVIDIDQSPYRTQPRLSEQSVLRTADPESNSSVILPQNVRCSFLDDGLSPSPNRRTNSQRSPSENMKCGYKTPNRLSTSNTANLSYSLVISTSTPKKANSLNSGRDSVQGLSKSFQELHFEKSSNSPRKSSNSPMKRSGPRHLDLVFSNISMKTSLVFASKLDDAADAKDEEAQQDLVTYDKIGGLSRQLKTIRETLELPLRNPEFFKSLGVPPPRGVLMYGPPGVGKTMIARAVANEVGAHVTIINGPEVMSKYYGESEARLRNIFQEAAKNAPSLIFIDELDALCPHREKVQSDLEKRIVATLLTLMDGVDSMLTRGHLMVLGATNRPDAIDPALRRPGRFDREIEIGVPNAVERADILTKCLQRIPHTLTERDIVTVADTAHGYVGADLAAVCKEAAIRCFERQKGSLIDAELKDDISVSPQDIVLALKGVKPSAMREVEIRVPKVYWSDIGGQASIKQKLKQAVEWPIKHPEAFQRMGITPPRGILMYGPPGCSKTLIAKALATESGLNFIAVKGPELFNKWVGESERAVREVFRKARLASPAIIFFDEMDALAVERGSSSGGNSVADRVLGQLLTEIDGVEKLQDVTIVAATNRPDMIDKALLRPGRLDRILYISLPDAQTREEIFRIQFRGMPIAPDVDVNLLVERTESYSGAEVVAVCREAGLSAMQEDIDADCIHPRHFLLALETVEPRTSPQLIQFYEEYQHKSGLHSI
ncbi:ATPase family gene 2 protein homolog A-like [Asterias amurensis]|uniref:ATPase family gene 2 protein homolog A-like n=1 Tax=Asterias amurensis TaxID=7602 RepID=UPI003AB86A5B